MSNLLLQLYSLRKRLRIFFALSCTQQLYEKEEREQIFLTSNGVHLQIDEIKHKVENENKKDDNQN